MVKILFGGGCMEAVEGDCLKTTTIYDNRKLNFEEDSPFKIPRRGGQLHKIEGKLIVVGGCEGYMKHLDNIEVYNNHKWSVVEDVKLPGKNSCFCSININDTSVIIFGGFNGNECLNDVYQIKSQNDLLEVINLPKLCTRLKNGGICGKENDPTNILLFGGWDEERTLKTIFEYDLENQNLLMHGLMCVPLEGHSVTNIGPHNKFAIISGGYDGISVVSSMFLYNYQEKSMKKLDVCLKIARENHCGIYDEEKKLLYIANGWNGYEALDSIEIFEIINQEPWLIAKSEVFSPIKRNKPSVIIL
uniref:Uncharacterized protein n=1 Tax=Strongyloides papillosus TaxID=174720 RepID=A0A0N5C5C1_STREA